MSTNLKLAIAAVLLLAVSVWVWADSLSRGDRFQRGRKLLPNLALDEVSTIVITEGGETTTLRRGADGFTVAEVHDYPAKNETVNRFLRDLLDVGLEKEVGTGADLARELELEPPTDTTIDVTLRNAAGQDMVRLRLGKTFTDGAGRYLQRLDRENAPIYLTSAGVFLSTTADEFLDKEIVDEPPSKVVRVEGVDFVLAAAEEGATPSLTRVPAGKKEKTSETARLRSLLDRLTFDRVYLADDPEVRDLAFERRLRVFLDDETSYTLSAASRDDRSFLEIRGDHAIGQVMITLETPEDELREKAAQLTRAEQIGQFNEFHSSWVYEIPRATADKLALTERDLVE
ncbi:MAG TPA: DUF4340 domain-containing protein [Thermoanaerobaculia bacterium]|nr:DUF4340 domain-containing protein [Thermoanaerobaculia bacterium]